MSKFIISRKKNGTFQKGFISPKRNGELRNCRICDKVFYLQGFRKNDTKRGKTCSIECGYKLRKGQRKSPKTEFKKGENLNEKHPLWKGDKVGYFGLHTWVQRKLGKAKKCIKCNSEKRVQWANKSHKYKRSLIDWLELCSKCHGKYDSGKNYGLAVLKFNKYYERKN